jgi:hypothetical protein
MIATKLLLLVAAGDCCCSIQLASLLLPNADVGLAFWLSAAVAARALVPVMTCRTEKLVNMISVSINTLYMAYS